MGIFTVSFWKDAAERAVKTAAQSVLLAWGVGDQIFDLFAVDVRVALGAAAGGVAVSLLTSIVSAPFSAKGTASLVV